MIQDSHRRPIAMTASAVIRTMCRSDLARVTQLDLLLFGEKRLPSWPFSFEVYWRECGPDISLVADIGHNVVGFIVGRLVVEEHSRSALNLRLSNRAHPYVRVGWIDMIGVHPDSQHAGIGRRLVEGFCNECKSQNVEVRAEATEHNAMVRRFLEAAGFKGRDSIVYEKDP